MTTHPFIGRKKELKLLNGLLKKKSASFVILRGRYRIGKSHLIKEFAKNSTHYIFSATSEGNLRTAAVQREEFARQLQQVLNIPLPRSDDWGDLFWHLAQATVKGKILIVFDEINWIGSKDPLFFEKLHSAWNLYFKKNRQLILILVSSASSWLDEQLLKNPEFSKDKSLDINLEELSLPECNQFWNKEDAITPFDKFKILSLTGGIPHYLKELSPDQNAEINIQQLCFMRGGMLFTEFESILSSLYPTRNSIYRKILERLADAPCELKDIYAALGVEKSGVISGYMEDLIAAGFVSQDITWHLKSGLDSKLSHYRLKDNYLRFYLKYVGPNRNKIEQQGQCMTLQPLWQPAMGMQFFKNIVLNNYAVLHKKIKIDPTEIVRANPFFQRKTCDRLGCHIDYMIQTKFGVCYLCEIRFVSHEISTSVIDEVKQKIRCLALPKNISIKPVLIHVNGVDKDVAESDFFSSILSFNDLFA